MSRGLSALPVTTSVGSDFRLHGWLSDILLGIRSVWSHVLLACGRAFLITGYMRLQWAFSIAVCRLQMTIVVRQMPSSGRAHRPAAQNRW